MKKWIPYLDIENKYKNEDKKKKCLLFVFLWMQYNEFYNLKYPNIAGDKNKALLLSDETIIKNKYDNLKQKFIKKFQSIDGADIPRTWIVNYNNNAKIYFTLDNNTCKNFLEIVYVIRGNLFHGDKPPIDINVNLITWAYECLNELIFDYITTI